MNWLLFIFITGWSGHHTSLEVVPFATKDQCENAMWKIEEWGPKQADLEMRCIYAEEVK